MSQSLVFRDRIPISCATIRRGNRRACHLRECRRRHGITIHKRQIQLSVLEGEINAAARHAEVVVPPVHNIPAEIAHPADVWSNANLQARAELADRLGSGTQVISRGNRENDEIITRRSLVKAFSRAAAAVIAFRTRLCEVTAWRAAKRLQRITSRSIAARDQAAIFCAIIRRRNRTACRLRE